MPKPIDMSNKRFASIVGIKPVGRCASGDIKWLFTCDCGTQFIANGYHARCGKITTCPECSKKRTIAASTTHGLTNTAEYEIWVNIKTRCNNPNAYSYPNYGGRGISICKEWGGSFSRFLSDMGPRPSKLHSIDRINNDGNYEPDNCRWATQKEQANNQRTNHNITINGVTKTLQQWADESDITSSAILVRLKSGLNGHDLIAPNKRKGSITFQGVTDTIAGWSRKTGIKQSTIAMRLTKYEWSVEKTLTTRVTK